MTVGIISEGQWHFMTHDISDVMCHEYEALHTRKHVKSLIQCKQWSLTQISVESKLELVTFSGRCNHETS